MPRSRNESPGGWRRGRLNRSSGQRLWCDRRYARRICRDPRRDHAAEPYGGGKPDGARAADVRLLPVRRGRAGRAFRAAAAGGGAIPVSRRHDRARAGARRRTLVVAGRKVLRTALEAMFVAAAAAAAGAAIGRLVT